MNVITNEFVNSEQFPYNMMIRFLYDLSIVK